jgi:hypothetical protein
MPYLKNYVKDNMVAVQSAEFVFPKVDSLGDAYTGAQPSLLLLRPRGSDTKDYLGGFTDDLIGYYDGKWSAGNNSYHFVISRHVQTLFYGFRNKAGFIDYGLNLSTPADNPNSPVRAILSNLQSPNSPRPKLILTYTKVADK